ncbi:hypothetical protein FXB39_16650 [Nocardioides sp. BGMRC 2183]|nr:hypothetical protein FXB39_16650 [Nocardioides sp. BGMRC 2183]
MRAAGARVIAAREPLPGCVGVHLAAHQVSAAARGLPFGRSCHRAADVTAAVDEGARWVTLSPFAASASKPDHGPALPRSSYEVPRIGGACCAPRCTHAGDVGVDRWSTRPPHSAALPSHAPRDARDDATYPRSLHADRHPVPVLALGGITADNAADALAAGADGIAVMGAVMRAADTSATVTRLRAAIAGVARDPDRPPAWPTPAFRVSRADGSTAHLPRPGVGR